MWQKEHSYMYTIFRRVENGELFEVANSEEHASAERLMRSFKKLFPAEYVIRESEPDDKSSVSIAPSFAKRSHLNEMPWHFIKAGPPRPSVPAILR